MIFPSARDVRPWNKCLHYTLLLSVMIVLEGCSTSEPISFVDGKVTLDDEPVVAGSVLFLSDDGRTAGAQLEPDGTYTLECRPGQFRVAVVPLISASEEAALHAPERDTNGVGIPSQYQDVASSGLTVEANEGANRYDISMSSESTTR